MHVAFQLDLTTPFFLSIAAWAERNTFPESWEYYVSSVINNLYIFLLLNGTRSIMLKSLGWLQYVFY